MKQCNDNKIALMHDVMLKRTAIASMHDEMLKHDLSQQIEIEQVEMNSLR